MLNTQEDNQYVLLLTYMFYVFIFVFGLAVNIQIICNVTSGRSKQRVTNVFMSNLAVANILLCIFVVPTFPMMMITTSWPFGSFMCHLWPCIYHSVCYASMLTLASIALFHRWTIVHSSEHTITKKKLIVISILIWLVSLLISLPRGIFSILIETGNDRNLCLSQWTSDSSHENYLIITFIVMMLVPLIAIVCCFCDTSFKLSHLSCTQMNPEIQEDTRTHRLIVMLTVVFSVCWMPTAINEMVPDAVKSSQGQIVIGLFHAMAVSSTCYIPLFYMWLNKNTIKQIFGLCCKFNQSSNEGVDVVNTTLQGYDNAVTFNVDVDTVDTTLPSLPTYDEAVTNTETFTPPPTYGVAITFLYYGQSDSAIK